MRKAGVSKEVKKEVKPESKLYAVVRVRGGFKIRRDFKDTLRFLRLNKKHHCVLIKDSPVNKGMITKLNDYVTWGVINKEVLKELIKKRGRLKGHKKLALNDKELDSLINDLMSGKKSIEDVGINPVFRLTPPRKGWERGTIKLRYPRGGLGPRGDKINELLKRMI